MRAQLALIAGSIALATSTAVVAAQAQKPAAPATTHEAGAHQHADAAALKNPVKTSPASIAAGKKLYDTQCATCHGATGKGDGRMAVMMPEPKPSDLSDATWKHGSTDGEIFTLIRDGSKGTGMRGYAARMKTQDIWNVVNYLRTLAPKPNAR
jgi:mono/diheme cytochrome c family protein